MMAMTASSSINVKLRLTRMLVPYGRWYYPGRGFVSPSALAGREAPTNGHGVHLHLYVIQNLGKKK